MRHWVFPMLCALAIHALLFTFDPPWTRPEATIPERRAVTLSLALLVPRPVERQPIAPLAVNTPRPIAPIAPVVHQTPPTEVPPATPLTPPKPPATTPPQDPPPLPPAPPDDQPLAEPEPVAPPPSETAAVAAVDAQASRVVEAVTTADPTDREKDQAEVQASVPIYHLNPPPEYPAMARRRSYEGTVLLDVLVDRQGRAAQVKLARSSGHAVLDRSALQSVGQWRFEPARRLGQPMEMWVQVPVRFALN